jgi:hypothetical protein
MQLTSEFINTYTLFSECEYDAPLEFIWHVVRASPNLNLFTGNMCEQAAAAAAAELHEPSFDDDDER